VDVFLGHSVDALGETLGKPRTSNNGSQNHAVMHSQYCHDYRLPRTTVTCLYQ